MPNPGAFHGSRKEFLMGERDAYARGVAGGYAAEALAVIQRRYFKRYPPDLADNVEPSPEHLSRVDDDAPDPEISPPDETTMSAEEFAAAKSAIEARQQKVAFKKAQIKRWLIYQHVKENDVNPKNTEEKSPYAHIIAKLTGQDLPRPRMKTAVNHWRKEHRVEIEEEAKSRSQQNGLQKADQAALRDLVAREQFSKLLEEERNEWTKIAEERHAEALDAWKKEVGKGISSSPADRQRAIQGVVHFAQSFLDAICEATGWKATLLVGGPEPAQGGRLNVISIHLGTTTGDVKMTFGRSERVDIMKYIIPIFGKFLQKCYSPEECSARALPEDGDLSPISRANFNPDEATVHSIQPRSSDTEPVSSTASNLQGQSSEVRDVTPVAPVAPVARRRRPRPTATALPAASESAVPAAISRPTTEPLPAPLAAETEGVTPSTANPAVSRSPSPEMNPFPYDVSSMLKDSPRQRIPSVPPVAAFASTPGPTSPVPSRPVSPAPSRLASPAPSCPATLVPSRLASPTASCPVPPVPSRLDSTAASHTNSHVLDNRASLDSTPLNPAQAGPFFDSAELSAAITAARQVTSGVSSIITNAILAPINSLPSLNSSIAPATINSEKETIPQPALPADENRSTLTDVAEPPQSRRSNRIAAGAALKANQSTSASMAPRRSKRQRNMPEDTQEQAPLKRARVKATPKASAAVSAPAPVTRGRKKTKA